MPARALIKITLHFKEPLRRVRLRIRNAVNQQLFGILIF